MKFKEAWIGAIGATVGGLLFAYFAYYLSYIDKKEDEIEKMGDQMILIQKDIQNTLTRFDQFDYKFNSIMTSIDKIDDKVYSIYNNVYRKAEINTKIDRVENDLKNQITRLGNVMYNDRQELSTGVNTNHERLVYLYGVLQLNKSTRVFEKNEKVNLSKN